jgi:antibiotic biosynthesis monooxygenase (ABM) superfamily enzyme
MSIVHRLTIGLVLVLCFAAVVQAQGQTKPEAFIQVTTVNVKPAMIPDWEDFQKKLNAARNKIPGAPLVSTYVLTLGGPAATYRIISPFEKWANREEWPAVSDTLAKVYGQAEANRMLKTVREATEHQETEVFSYQANASINPKLFDPPAAIVSLVRTEIHPEMSAAYSEFLNKLKIAREKSKDPRTITIHNSIYGTAFTVLATTTYAKLGDRDIVITAGNMDDLIRNAFGETEGARLIDIGARAVRNRQVYILTYRADLSRPRATSSN